MTEGGDCRLPIADCRTNQSAIGNRQSAFIHVVIVAVAFVAMIAWTWFRWPDPLVDFGRELYVPWQVSQGKRLYRDVAHFSGPLSVYFNALMFRALGVSLRTIVVVNIAIAAAVVAMIWALARHASRSRFAATVVVLLFVTLFMSIQLVDIGNYNWITPYAHELTHGIALGLAAMLVLASHLGHPRPWRAALVGALLGLILLTKVEVILAAAPAVTIGIWMPRRRYLVQFVVATIVAPAIAIVALGSDAVFGPWKYALNPRLAALPFYRWSTGTDAPAHNVVQAVVVPIKLLVSTDLTLWQGAFRGLLFTTLAIAILCAIRATRRVQPRAVLRLSLSLFALLLLAKIALNVRVNHYGFALAMPAMLVTAGALSSMRRRWIRIATTLALIVTVVVHLYVYATRFREKPVVVASDRPDAFRADARGALVNELVRTIDSVPADATLAVFPQGAMINYLAGRANPTPFVTLMPPEVIMFGDERITAAYEQSPPDVIVVIDTDLSEYGFKSFDEVAPKLAGWMREKYETVRSVPALAPELPGAHVLRRR